MIKIRKATWVYSIGRGKNDFNIYIVVMGKGRAGFVEVA